MASRKKNEALSGHSGEGLFEGDAHAFLISIYRDPSQPLQSRIDAAAKALPYEKPRLQSVMLTGEVSVSSDGQRFVGNVAFRPGLVVKF